eukprot:10544498-Karenia_brevis.AAC.2
MGDHWRSVLDQCQDAKQWKGKSREFVTSTAEKYKLPSSFEDKDNNPTAAGPGAHDKETNSQRPTLRLEEPGISWASCSHHFVLVVDCLPLQNIICGHAPLLNDSFRPLMSRVLDSLLRLIGQGWTPPSMIDDPVIWTRRENNQLADYLCNYTMDSRRSSWRHERHVGDEDFSGIGNLLVFSDGGTRPDCSASAWLVGHLIKSKEGWRFKPRVAAGMYFEAPISSFMAEAIALENAALELERLLRSA